MPSNEATFNPQLKIRPGFHWAHCPAYLFDIDGTLLRCRDHVHASSFAEAVARVTGERITLDGVPVAGNTDTAILAAAWRNAGLDPRRLEQQQTAILAAMCAYVAAHRGQLQMEIPPGVEQTLELLTGYGALLGVATGNLEQIAWAKLEAAGLRKWFRFGGFSDRYTSRARLVEAAAAEANRLLGMSHAGVCVVGDTPRDIEAARAAGVAVVAVATGHYAWKDLAELNPEVCVSTLADLLDLTASPALEG